MGTGDTNMTSLPSSAYHARNVKKLPKYLQCDGKAKHLNIHHATMAYTTHPDRERCCIYRCPHCHHFHLGHKQTKTQKILARKEFVVVTLPRRKIQKGAMPA